MANGPYYEEGRYRGRVVKQALGQAKTGTPQIVIRFKVLEGENGESVQQYERTIFRAITAKTMPYLLEDLKTLGYTRDSFRYIDPNEPNYHSFEGQEFLAYCQHKEDLDGNPREQWGIVTESASQLDVKPLESKKLRELDNLFGKQLRTGLGGAPPKAEAKRASSTATATVAADEPAPFAPVTDDDVPF